MDSESINCGSSPHPGTILGSSSGRTLGFEPGKHSSNLCPRTKGANPWFHKYYDEGVSWRVNLSPSRFPLTYLGIPPTASALGKLSPPNRGL